MLNPKAINGEHILNDEWSLWYENPNEHTSTYGENIKEIYSFQSVENFWRLYHNTNKASQLKPSSSYFLFRKGVTPQWEDPQNENGGRWIHYCNYPSSSNSNELNEENEKQKEMKDIEKVKEEIEEKWVNTMLACIGEDFPSSEFVKGCVINSKRNQMRISLWINCKDNQKMNKLIGQKFKMILNIENEKVVFHYHQNDSSDYYNLLSL